MASLRLVDALCSLIEHQSKLIHQLTIELENANGISEVARQMMSEIESEEKSILGE